MEGEKSSRRSCSTQTCFSEDLGEDSQLDYLSAQEEYEEDRSEFSVLGEVGEAKDLPLTADKVQPQITAGGEGSGKSKRRTQSVALDPDVPFLPLSGEKAQLSRQAEPSSPSGREEPALRTCAASGTAEDGETRFPVPETLPSTHPIAGMEAADKCSGGSPSAEESERGEALGSVPGADSRAAVPTGRGSRAWLCVRSRAVNTEVTMMNRAPPLAWLAQTTADAASNTEWSIRAQSSRDPGENSLQKTSTCSSVGQSGIFVSPYALNLSSFTKLIKRLQERHPGFSKQEIVEAVQEVRRINKGVLSGLSISSIEEKTSAILRRSVCCAQQE
ncbi:hypothetical protein DUI87_30795 [Hirundo rustica rustica]|uniref:TTC3/DZIP3/RBM44-like helical domain-containing protein n=1 Tax=Hirundo rustica rustica TaxID=333673 RepID=A0A3M0IVP5_HIRRU|nr:hypothetical protein DUI87_30795 [Hirundo rustica rustica]